MASKRRNRRRRRGRASFPLRLLCLAVVIAAFLGALTMFFRIDMIVVEGNERYTEEQIIEAAGVQKEQNLVLLNKYKVKQSIFDTLPYVETVVINRKYPDALILTVTECTASAALTGEKQHMAHERRRQNSGARGADPRGLRARDRLHARRARGRRDGGVCGRGFV